MNVVLTAGNLGRRPSRALLALATLTSASCRRIAASAAPDDAGIEAVGTWGGLRVRTVGERKQPRQVVILLHGWGAPGDDLVPLGEELAASGRLLVFPEAPLTTLGGGRAWWTLDLARLQAARVRGQERELRQETPAGLAEARAQVTALIAEVTRRARVPATSVWLGGFSQGAMLSTDVVLRAPTSVGGLVIMSGSLIAEAEWEAQLKTMKPGLPIFMSHGRADPVLPFSFAELLRDRLQAAQQQVTWVPFEGGHGIPGVVLGRLAALLAAPSSQGSTAN